MKRWLSVPDSKKSTFDPPKTLLTDHQPLRNSEGTSEAVPESKEVKSDPKNPSKATNNVVGSDTLALKCLHPEVDPLEQRAYARYVDPMYHWAVSLMPTNSGTCKEYAEVGRIPCVSDESMKLYAAYMQPEKLFSAKSDHSKAQVSL